MGENVFSPLRTLIVPGLNNSGPGHWQTHWQLRYPHFERVEQVCWDTPELLVWSEQLRQSLLSDNRPTLIAAHSFGCLATVHCANSGAPNLIGALLVAPADPEKFGLEKVLLGARLHCPSIVVGSTDDPWMASDRAIYWASQWGSEFVNAGALGHINAESDLGHWEFGLLQIQRLISAARG
ncbi:RBBP9/YdeN family alpha/beta hydrolase [Solimicrobium silvestre]|uniref:Putative esterase of the alpha/beta hydrolase fold n=1 Tax=Solimicrobium silvestre TaxID=2099400 RepID=A0A2S9H2T8_9BURK|nr:alpha/beta hydrolase [Solimicrobium silvestre]PRC94253.1 putative esterase of the alpha/beta hydrolase fold [Solimicrobium silvestre]